MSLNFLGHKKIESENDYTEKKRYSLNNNKTHLNLSLVVKKFMQNNIPNSNIHTHN